MTCSHRRAATRDQGRGKGLPQTQPCVVVRTAAGTPSRLAVSSPPCPRKAVGMAPWRCWCPLCREDDGWLGCHAHGFAWACGPNPPLAQQPLVIGCHAHGFAWAWRHEAWSATAPSDHRLDTFPSAGPQPPLAIRELVFAAVLRLVASLHSTQPASIAPHCMQCMQCLQRRNNANPGMRLDMALPKNGRWARFRAGRSRQLLQSGVQGKRLMKCDSALQLVMTVLVTLRQPTHISRFMGVRTPFV